MHRTDYLLLTSVIELVSVRDETLTDNFFVWLRKQKLTEIESSCAYTQIRANEWLFVTSVRLEVKVNTRLRPLIIFPPPWKVNVSRTGHSKKSTIYHDTRQPTERAKFIFQYPYCLLSTQAPSPTSDLFIIHLDKYYCEIRVIICPS